MIKSKFASPGRALSSSSLNPNSEAITPKRRKKNLHSTIKEEDEEESPMNVVKNNKGEGFNILSEKQIQSGLK